MGSQIADIMAFNGLKVVVVDVSETILSKCLSRIEGYLDDLLKFHNKRADNEISRIRKEDRIELSAQQVKTVKRTLRPTFNHESRDRTLDLVEFSTRWDGLGDIDLVIEAATEDLDVKRSLFERMEKTCPSSAILASNTSTLPISEIARSTSAQDRVVGMHFFNPPVTLPLIEIISGKATAETVVTAMMRFSSSLRNHLGKMIPIQVKEVPGFIVNRILMAMLNEAYQLYEDSAASIEDIDSAMKLGARMPLGPFELSDLIGIDIIYQVNEALGSMLGKKSKYGPHPSIESKYREGKYGRKTGQGFYRYDIVRD